MKLVARGDTTVVDAYLSPILRRYVDQVARASCRACGLLFMQSNGGLTRRACASRARTRSCPGPAGGIVGMVAHRAGAPASTRSSASTWAAPRPTSRTSPASSSARSRREVAGVRMRAPMMSIHTVAAGGGSILQLRRRALSRRARSRPAPIPGPACYRRGGPLTVTDCNVMLGKIQPDVLPAGVRRRRRRAARRATSCARKFAALAARDRARDRQRAHARGSRRRLPAHRRRRTWPTRSSRSRCSAATTSPSTRSRASAAPAASTPAWSPTRSA